MDLTRTMFSEAFVPPHRVLATGPARGCCCALSPTNWRLIDSKMIIENIILQDIHKHSHPSKLALEVGKVGTVMEKNVSFYTVATSSKGNPFNLI